MQQLGGALAAAIAGLAPQGAEHGAGAAHAAGHGPTGEVTGHLGAWVLLIPFLPLFGAVLAGVFAALRVRSKLPAWTTVGCLGAAFVLTLLMYLQTGSGEHAQTAVVKAWDWISFRWGFAPDGAARAFVANFSFYVDSLTCLWMLFVTGLATLIALYASEYMAGDVGPGYCRFYAAFCLFVFSMACLVMGDNLVLLYLGWEGVGLCSYLLIGYFYKKPSAVAAAKKAFIMNRVGDLGLAMGIMLTYVQFGTVEYRHLFPLVQEYLSLGLAGRFDEIPFLVQLIPVLFTVGAFGKSAQLPLYVWLPDAMEGPTPVSALIHAATMVTAGVYLVCRAFPLYQASEHALAIVAWGGALTAFLAATIGMAQFDIKRIMAYSTVSQLGYMFAGVGVATSYGAAFHVFTHAFFKAMLFLSCGAVMHGFAGQLDLRKLSGVAWMKGWGIVGVAMLVGCLNLAGFPFTAGFFSKDTILAEAFVWEWSSPIGWLLLLTAGLTAYYTFRVFFRVFVGPKYHEPGDELHGHAGDHPGAHAVDDHGHHHSEIQKGPGQDAQHADAEGHLARKTASREEHGHVHADEHGHGHAFHPHAPGWAINTVLLVLTVASLFAALAYPTDWVKDLVSGSTAAMAHGEHHGSFLGFDPHKVMYYVSAVVGLIGIAAAYFLHSAGRTAAATARADALLPAVGPVARWAQRKWYVDELYDFLIVKPLWVISHVLHLLDKVLVDGLVNLFGALPRLFGSRAKRQQTGVLHDYALRMVGGICVIVAVALLLRLGLTRGGAEPGGAEAAPAHAAAVAPSAGVRP